MIKAPINIHEAMPLNSEQRAATIREFQENMSRLGLTAERIGKDFGVSGSRVEQIITLKSGVLDYPRLSAEQS